MAMRIGELAKLADVTTRTIRYYEQLGLLGVPEREDSGYRTYTEDTLARLKKIDVLKQVGLSLEEIASVLPLYFQGTTTSLEAKYKVLEILEGHHKETVSKIADLTQFQREIEANIAFVKSKIAEFESQE